MPETRLTRWYKRRRLLSSGLRRVCRNNVFAGHSLYLNESQVSSILITNNVMSAGWGCLFRLWQP